MDTGYAFSHLAAARTLSDMIVGQILQPETANRLIAFADRQENALTLPGADHQVARCDLECTEG